MCVLMFGMGLTLSPEDFRRLFVQPRPSLLGMALQLLVMPLLGLALVLVFRPDPWLAAGVMIAAALPGGVLSNMVTHLGRLVTPLSITLSCLATAVTIFTIPFWIQAGLQLLGGSSDEIALPLIDTALDLAAFTLLPVALGMLARHWKPELVEKELWFTRLGALVLIIALWIDGQNDLMPAASQFASAFWPTFLLTTGALILGLACGRLARLTLRQTTTLALELFVKNSVLGLYVSVQALQSLEASVPIIILSGLQIPFFLVLLGIYHFFLKKRDS